MDVGAIHDLISMANDMACSVLLAWLLYTEIRRRNGKD